MQSSAATLAFFEAVAHRYDRDFAFSGAEQRRRAAPIVRALGPAPRRVLDLGIGTGRELSWLLDAGHDVVGIDLSPSMIAECKKRARPVPVVEGDFYQPLPWDPASFDVVIALHGSLAHPPHASALSSLVAEVRRVLRGGGLFCFEVPHQGILGAGELGASVLGDGELGDGEFIAELPGGGLRMRGVAWSAGRWQELLAEHFHVRQVWQPSPLEHAFLAESR